MVGTAGIFGTDPQAVLPGGQRWKGVPHHYLNRYGIDTIDQAAFQRIVTAVLVSGVLMASTSCADKPSTGWGNKNKGDAFLECGGVCGGLKVEATRTGG